MSDIPVIKITQLPEETSVTLPGNPDKVWFVTVNADTMKTKKIKLRSLLSYFAQFYSDPFAAAYFNLVGAGGIKINDATSFKIYPGNTVVVTDNTTVALARSGYGTANIAWITANGAYSKANVANTLANSALITARLAYNTGNTIWIQANTARNTANIVWNQANSAYNTSNVVWAAANTVFVNSSKIANSAYNTANSAWAAANSKLSSSGGTVTGNVSVTGRITQSLGLPKGDNSTNVATTAFVQTELGSFSVSTSFVTTGGVPQTTALNSNYFGTSIECSGTTSLYLTLPYANSGDTGKTITISNYSSAAVQVDVAGGSDKIWPGKTYRTNVILYYGETLSFTTNGSSNWYAKGTGTLKYSDAFSSSNITSGYQKLPSGLIIQWGEATTTSAWNAETEVTLPISFPTSFASLHVSPKATSPFIGGWRYEVHAPRIASLSKFYYNLYANYGYYYNNVYNAIGQPVTWIAIGY